MHKSPIVWPHTDAIHSARAAAEWEPIVNEYESNPADLYTSWLYLGHHPIFWVVRAAWSGTDKTPVLDFSSAWNRPECLELNLERDGDTTNIVLDVMPELWDADPDGHEVGFSMEGGSHASLIVAVAAVVHDRYGNDRQFITGDDGRWYG